MAIAKRKKRFFDVEIPLIEKTTQLQAYDLKELENKIIKYDLTRILRGKSMLLQCKVIIKDDKAIAIPTKANLLPYFLKRMVKKGTNYVEDSFSTNCKNAQLRVKPFFVTRRKVSRAVRKALREKGREELIKELATKTSNTIFEDILKNKIQKELSLKLKKIYPLSLCEIRVLKIEKELETKTEETPKEEKPVKEEKVEEKPIKKEKVEDSSDKK